MASSLKLGHVPRYGELGALLLAHRDVLRDPGAAAGKRPDIERDAARLVDQLEALGPTYVKLGQLLSSRVDLLPEAYVEALRRLQDQAAPLDFGDVRAVVEEELGGRLSFLFRSFDPEPIGSASLAQVHRARLPDGDLVAVKVQRPGVRSRVLDDMDVIGELAAAVDHHSGAARRAGLTGVVDQFRRALLNELDYTHEATSLRMLAAVLEPYDCLFAPHPIDDLSSSRVLTMSFVDGVGVGAVAPGSVEASTGRKIVDQLFRAYLDQVLVHGVFHADPHPGNLLLTSDGRIGLIDVGMTAQVSPGMRHQLLRMVVALDEGHGAAVAAALERVSEPLDDFDREGLTRDVSALVLGVGGLQVSHLELGRHVAALARISVERGLRPAPELSMIGKALLHLDHIARHIAPEYDMGDAVRRHAASIMRHQLTDGASPSNLVSAALDAKEFAEHLPERMNKVLDALAEGTFHINVDGMDEADVMRSVQKLANRAAAGLTVAAFVLAAAIFSISGSGPRWLGESVLTVVLLGLACFVGAAILLSTFRHDVPQRHSGGRRRSTRA